MFAILILKIKFKTILFIFKWLFINQLNNQMYTQVVAWKVELFIEGNMKDKKHLFLFGYYKGFSNDFVGFVLEAVKKML